MNRLVIKICIVLLPVIIIAIILIKDSPVDKSTRLCINEVMLKNLTCVTDNEGYYLGWVELYNGTSESINLDGFGISDDHNDLYKFIIRDIVIAPGSYQLFFFDEYGWCDDNIHMVYLPDDEGTNLFLTAPDQSVVDSVKVPESFYNISYGRSGDTAKLVYFMSPTPGYENNYVSGSQDYEEYTALVNADYQSGVYNDSFYVTLSTDDEDATIIYTLDGSEPLQKAYIYSEPIFIHSDDEYDGVTLRARTYKNNQYSESVLTESYLFNDSLFTLPRISLTVDPFYMFDTQFGAYRNGEMLKYLEERGKDYILVDNSVVSGEILGTIDAPLVGLKSNARIKLRGGSSRSELAQKSMSVYTDDTFELFGIPNNSSLRLRTWGGGTIGNYEDSFINEVSESLDLGVYHDSFVEVYINGEYWGIYSLDSDDDLTFFRNHYGIKSSDLVCISYDADKLRAVDEYRAMGGSTKIPMLSVGKVSDLESYNELYNQLFYMDLSNEDNYKWVCNQFDIENFTKYVIVQTFFGNVDWPEHNVMVWKTRNISDDTYSDGRWRFKMYDVDATMHEDDILTYLLQDIGVREQNGDYMIPLLLRKLWVREDYRNYYKLWTDMILDSIFEKEALISAYRAQVEMLNHDMPANILRMNRGFKQDEFENTTELTYDTWSERNKEIITFLESRGDFYRRQVDYWVNIADYGSMAE